MPVGSGEALRLTVARYYLPSGRTIQAVGVTPDITVHPGKVARDNNSTFVIQEKDLKKHLEGELDKIDNKKSDETKEKEKKEIDKAVITEDQIYDDAQLKSAVDILRVLMITSQFKEEKK
jgi:carboxyl-terminal processing protease